MHRHRRESSNTDELGTLASDSVINSAKDEDGAPSNCKSSENDGVTPKPEGSVAPDDGRLKTRGILLRIGTWNVRTMFQAGKLDNAILEMSRMNLDILGISELRWKEAGTVDRDEFVIVFSGGERHSNGVGIIMKRKIYKAMNGFRPISERVIVAKFKGKPFDVVIVQVYAPTSDYEDEEVEKFYSDVDLALKSTKSSDVLFVMGDWNARVGNERYKDIIGRYGLDEKNERGERFIQFCEQHRLMVANTWFKLPKRKLYTWKKPGDTARRQIDYIAVSKRFRRSIRMAKTYPGADIGSDHNPVVVKVNIALKVVKKAPCKKARLDVELLREKEFREKYATSVHNRYEGLRIEEVEQTPDELWSNLKECMQDAADECLPKKKRVAKQIWMTDDILNLMEERRKLKRKDAEYRELDKQIRLKCQEAKEQWLIKGCREIEQLDHLHHTRTMHQKIKEVTQKNKKEISNGVIQDKEGNVLFEGQQIQSRWMEYIKELYEDDRSKQVKEVNEQGPAILVAEVEAALEKLRTGKACGLDGVPTEMLVSLGEPEIKELTKLCNVIYATGKWPEDFVVSEFVMIPKKTKSTKCTDFRTISLISHASKILLLILTSRIQSTILKEISDLQSGFVPGKGTREGIFNLRMIMERYLEKKKDVYMCFLDYKKAFDRVNHEKLISCLNSLGLDGKDVRLIASLYWNQKAVIRSPEGLSPEVRIQKGVRQGCMISPLLFNIYSEMIFRVLKDEEGIKIGGLKINNLRYADDSVILAESEEDLQRLVGKVNDEGERFGMAINVSKTKTMVVSRKKEIPRVSIQICDTLIEQVSKFVYLGQTVTEDGKCDNAIKQRIEIARSVFMKMEKILCCRSINFELRCRIWKCYIWSTLLYGVETWTLCKETERKLEAFEMWCFRRMLRISWVMKINNKEVLNRAKKERELISTVQRRKLVYVGHMMREGGLQKILLEGMVEGKRERGRQRSTWFDDVKKWTGLSYGEVRTRVHDRRRWRCIAANPFRRDGTR